ncbi:MAG: hypothetical protein IH595_06225 [Bacteroidales bacterium]|nr:hypothetical protein [Bacteroidales bacterium]
MKAINNSEEKLPLEQLVSKLKDEDIKYSKLSKSLLYIYVVLIGFYAIATLLLFIFERHSNQFYGAICYLVSFIIFAILFRQYYKEYKSVDYSLPTIQMLKQAAYRYKPFQWRLLWLLLVIGIIDAGFTLTVDFHFSFWTTQMFILGVFALAFVIGIIYWRVRYKPLRDNVLHLIKEIES